MTYLDHAAATPVSKKALAAMLPFFSEDFFNPSAPYLPAKRVREAYESSKSTIANFIGAKSTDLVITSGATEANALALSTVKTGTALVLETEHPSVLENLNAPSTARLKVDRTGRLLLDDLKKKLDSSVTLVSISLANNELGTLQPLAEVAELLRKERISRLEKGNKTPLFFHSDASQGLPLLDLNVARLGVDFLTMNSAKVGGPKGVGALFVARGIRLSPLIKGGGQELGLRSGTENVPGVVGFATALSELKGHASGMRKTYARLIKILKSELEQSDLPPLFLGNEKHRLANFLPVSFSGLDAERLIFKLEEKGVFVSTGAACAASKGEPSHVLTAVGLSPEEIRGSLRLSLGPTNTEENVKQAGRLIREAVNAELTRINRHA